MRTILLIIFLGCCILAAEADEKTPEAGLRVDHAYLRKATKHDNGTIHIFLQNNGKKPVSIKSLHFDKRHLKKFPNAVSIWRQIVPEPIKPGEIGDLMIRMMRRWEKPITIKIEALEVDEASASANSPPAPATVSGAVSRAEAQVDPNKKEVIRLADVAFSQDLQKLYIYVKNMSDKSVNISNVRLNTSDVTEKTKICKREVPPGEKRCMTLELDKPLTQGDYISLRVDTKEKEIAEAVVRVFSFFPISAWPYPIGDWDGDTRRERFFDPIPFCRKYPTKDDGFVKGSSIPRQQAYYVFRDINCNDLEKMQMLGANAIEAIARMKRCRKWDPYHPTHAHICEHSRELSGYIYGEALDIAVISPAEVYAYPELRRRHYSGNPLRNGYFARAAKLSSEPRPVYTMIYAKKGESPKIKQRFPTPEEIRLSVYSQIAQGATGVLYSDRQSYIANKELDSAIGKINAELQVLKPYLRIGDPVEAVQSSSSDVEVHSILAGDRGLVVFVFNKDFKNHFVFLSKDRTGTNEKGAKAAFECKPKKSVEIKVKMPPEIDVRSAFEVGGSWEKVKYQKKEGWLTLTIDKLDVTKQIVLASSDDAYDYDQDGDGFSDITEVTKLGTHPGISELEK